MSKRIWDYSTIIWDFDGVILNSMEVKAEGLRKVLKDYPKDAVETLVKFHMENGGVSRYVKLRMFFREILEKEISDNKLRELINEFSEAMKVELSDPSYLIQDTLGFIKRHHRDFAMHIASGADQGELRHLCRTFRLSPYFLSIEGSPTPKEELVDGMIRTFGYNRRNTILIGDSKYDYEASIENGIDFAGINNEELRGYPQFYIEKFVYLEKEEEEK